MSVLKQGRGTNRVCPQLPTIRDIYVGFNSLSQLGNARLHPADLLAC